MPPRIGKAAGEDDRCPTLKLIMEKGPLSGQTSEFSPRSVIRIGRVARGNTLAIKDAGVSTKHLKIQAEANPDSGKRQWTITDLGSSNGTFLNGEELDSPTVLSDGDVIIIGEQTSIRVKFEATVVGDEISYTSTRKNVRRGEKDQATGLGVIDELGFGNEESVNRTDDVAELEVIQARNVSTRGTKNLQENDTKVKDSNTDENKDLGQNVVKELPGVNTRRTRSSRKEGGVTEAVIDLSVIEEDRKRRGRKKKVVETIPEETEKVEEKATEDINSGKEDGSIGLGSTSGVKKDSVNPGKGKIIADLDTMKMGEWLDFLEVYLPQQIIEESEAMIAEMRQDAERYHKFRVQQRKLKG